jgi:hypothetical protein
MTATKAQDSNALNVIAQTTGFNNPLFQSLENEGTASSLLA